MGYQYVKPKLLIQIITKVIFADMATGEEIKAAREARSMSQAGLAEAIGISQVAIKKIEAGQTLKSKYMPEIEAFLRLGTYKVREQPDGGTYKEPPRFMNAVDTMPVYASAEGGNGHFIVTTDEIDRVPRPYTLEGITDAYAILITGESMVPAYEPGDYAWVNPRLPPQRDTDCILYSIDDVTGESNATIKRLLSWDARAWKLRQYTPAKEFPLERGVWTKHHRVVGNFRRR